MSLEALRKSAKAHIHNVFAVPCSYLIASSQVTISVNVRFYESDNIGAGQLSGGDGWVEKQEQPIYMVFDESEVQSSRGDVATVDGVEYHIDIVLKSQKGYVTCEVV